MKNIKRKQGIADDNNQIKKKKIGSTEPVRRGRGTKDDKIHRLCQAMQLAGTTDSRD
jgi:hypothetical protein